MMVLFDQQKAVEQFGNEKRQEGIREGKQETALNLFHMGMPVENIAKAVKVGTEIVRQWLSGADA